MSRLADSLPAAVPLVAGPNLTLRLQLSPASMLLPHGLAMLAVLSTLNSAKFVPEMAGVIAVAVSSPLFAILMVCDELSTPLLTIPVNDAGLGVIAKIAVD